MKFKKNIGPKNRIARLVAGIILILLSLIYFDANKILSAVGIILGIIFLLEAAFSYCLLHGIRGTKDMR
ncbi:MAG: YgaP-like transmembrane domain [Candidatus Aenigmatarchaeota archaeon]